MAIPLGTTLLTSIACDLLVVKVPLRPAAATEVSPALGQGVGGACGPLAGVSFTLDHWNPNRTICRGGGNNGSPNSN